MSSILFNNFQRSFNAAPCLELCNNCEKIAATDRIKQGNYLNQKSWLLYEVIISITAR